MTSTAWLAASTKLNIAESLTPNLRQKLSAHYAEAALMEHASVAAFARFALHLLSLGAPAWILDETQQALRDEIEHARVCFALASSYAGKPLGPTPLSLDGAFDTVTPKQIILMLVKEACIGETLAAIEAGEASRQASVPELAQALSKISEEEARHAQLGWKSLVWALDSLSATSRAELVEDLRDLLRSELLSSARDANIPAVQEPEQALLSAHGMLSGDTQRDLRRSALREVVTPILETILTAPKSPDAGNDVVGTKDLGGGPELFRSRA